MEKWKREAIVAGLSVLLVFAFVELIWSFFAGQSWGSSILRDFVYLVLTGIITVIAVLTSDNELTQTQHKNSKFSGKESNNDINNTVTSETSGNANVKSSKNLDYGYPENPELRKAGEYAQNHYRNMVRKLDDFDLAEEKFAEEVESYLNSRGVEVQNTWYEDLFKYSQTDFEHFVLISLEQREPWSKFADEGVLGPMETYIVGCVEEIRGIKGFTGFSNEFQTKLNAGDWGWKFD